MRSSDLRDWHHLSWRVTNRSAERLFGVEFNSQVAELAATNLMLNGLPPTQIVTGNSLDPETFEGTSLHGLQQREFDVMALDPPIGGWEEDPRLIWASEIVRKSGNPPWPSRSQGRTSGTRPLSPSQSS